MRCNQNAVIDPEDEDGSTLPTNLSRYSQLIITLQGIKAKSNLQIEAPNNRSDMESISNNHFSASSPSTRTFEDIQPQISPPIFFFPEDILPYDLLPSHHICFNPPSHRPTPRMAHP
jgi:hypothetical protein